MTTIFVANKNFRFHWIRLIKVRYKINYSPSSEGSDMSNFIYSIEMLLGIQWYTVVYKGKPGYTSPSNTQAHQILKEAIVWI